MIKGTALEIVTQVASELGLAVPATLTNVADPTAPQLLAILNSAGNDLVNSFAWEELTTQWTVPVVANVDNYALPTDWGYFLDQTQWDRTNHWPLMGPRTAREWQWLKGGLLSSGPRLRYRVWRGKFYLHPAPASAWELVMEYVSTGWVKDPSGTYKNTITQDSDIPIFDKWLLVAFLKLKYLETKGLDTTAASKYFENLFNSITGKDQGASTIDLAGRPNSILIGPGNIADGSWNVTP